MVPKQEPNGNFLTPEEKAKNTGKSRKQPGTGKDFPDLFHDSPPARFKTKVQNVRRKDQMLLYSDNCAIPGFVKFLQGNWATDTLQGSPYRLTHTLRPASHPFKSVFLQTGCRGQLSLPPETDFHSFPVPLFPFLSIRIRPEYFPVLLFS